jgi:hypothetical protein
LAIVLATILELRPHLTAPSTSVDIGRVVGQIMHRRSRLALLRSIRDLAVTLSA